ncbi:flagellar basal-body MS-ring/collar protein FliF [uncultured Microbulbifer sp.]|uniref:flagellar basal-body MS-ring/collar protein FliF n=1 Tax=uncultured Microbulbifer sp. TaxID=348147 RepID=UPI00262FB93F|nr:flagellar basal-body MS-ring/collar protein FliF [uncultured Microbulbifer sp.]
MRLDLDSNLKKIFLFLFLFIFSACLATILFLLFKNNKEVLVGDLQGGEVTTVTKALIDNNILFDHDEKNGVVLVPEEKLGVARMILADNGLLDLESIGFEIFDDTSYGLTEFSQKIYYQRALQGELEKSIKTLEVVRSVRVHLVLPDSSLFKKNQEEAKASVVLTIKNNYNLGQDRVIGIQNLLAASVPKLKPANVTVMDTSGRLLSSTEMPIGGALQKVEFKKDIEGYYTKKINEIVLKLVDEKSAVVAVNVVIDYSKSESTLQNTLPLVNSDSGVLVSNKTSREYNNSNSSKSNGRLGGSGILSEKIENNYQYSSELIKKEVSPGRVSRISVSVLLTKDFTEDQIGKLNNLITNAVGLDATRGDLISIEMIPSLPSISTEKLVAPDDDPSLTLQVNDKPLVNTQNSPSWKSIIVGGENIYLYVILFFSFVVFLFLVLRRGRLKASERAEVLQDMRNWLDEKSNSEKISIK